VGYNDSFQLPHDPNKSRAQLNADVPVPYEHREHRGDFDYPEAAVEAEIVAREAGIDDKTATRLIQVAHRTRNLKGHGLDEGISTRLLVYAAQMIAAGVDPVAACQMTLVTPLTDDPDMRQTLQAAVETFFV
jgi:nitric oxide reductase NorQ protein